MDNQAIKETCKQIIDEANAVIAYTNSIEATPDSEATQTIFAEHRNDELSHLQKLVVALTELLSGKEPTEAEKME